MTIALDQLAVSEQRALLARLLREKAATTPKTGPLSSPQGRFWLINQLDPGSSAYNSPMSVRLTGALRLSALERGFNEVVRRHGSLRTSFPVVDEEPVQRVAPFAPFHLPLVDLGTLPPAERERELGRLAAEHVQRPFDLAQGPVFRLDLVRLSAREHIALLTVHHIVFDGWSRGVLMRELAEVYDASVSGRPPRLPELPIQYLDFAHWQHQQGERLEGQLAYWRRQLAGPLPVLELPTDHPRARQSQFRGACRWLSLPASLVDGLARACAQSGLTLFMAILAAYAAWLQRYTAQDELLIGTPIANRKQKEVEGLIGLFINTLVLRLDLGGDPTVGALMAQVRRVALAAYDHQDVPFERVVKEVQAERDLSRGQLFQTMCLLLNALAAELELPGLTLSPYELDSGTAKFDLTFFLWQTGGGLSGGLEYNRQLFEAATVERMLGHFDTLLRGLIAAPDARLSQLPFVSREERAQLLAEWNDTSAPLPGTDVVSLLTAQAARTPGAAAASCRGVTWSYAELDRRAGAAARRLAAAGVGAESVVVLLAERGLELLAGILGVWKAGGAYLPLDPRHPAERHRRILEQVQASAVLLALELRTVYSESAAGLAAPPPVLWLEEAVLPGEPLAAPAADPEGLTYVIFTSGSTGVPKGAMVVQRGMVNHLAAKIADLGLTGSDIVAQTASQCFDISVWQFVAPLLVGGRVQIYPDEVAHDPSRLLPELPRDGVSVVEIVPSLLGALLDAVLETPAPAAALGSLRWMIPTGEALPPDLARRWMAVAPEIALLNAYGPTECSDDVTHHRVEAEDLESGMVPIGRPVANTRLHVLSGGCELVPSGVPGELWVGGAGVGRGYLGDAAKTAGAFRPDPFGGQPGGRLYRTGDLAKLRPDGVLLFLGRIDHQVKIRGFRIELGEIETALGALPGVSQAVLVVQGAGAAQRLVGYAVSQPGADADGEDLRQALAERLPDYMVPAVIELLEVLPLTANGKVDRRALTEREVARPPAAGRVLPHGPQEELLVGIWREVLGLAEVGIHDNFFTLGGDSILSLQVASRARRAGIALAPRHLFEHQTIAELAATIDVAQGAAAGAQAVSGALPLLPAQRWFLEGEPADPGHFNQAVLLALRRRPEPAHLAAAYAVLTAHHDALRARFRRPADGAAGWQQEVTAPAGDLGFLGVVDLAGLPEGLRTGALEAAAGATQASLSLEQGTVQRLLLFDLGADRPGRLLWVIHHLVVDGVSWRVLLEDLAACLEELAVGRTPQLPARSTSVRSWAEGLAGLAESPLAAAELPIWTAQDWAAVMHLPRDFPVAGAGRMDTEDVVEVVLGREETRTLLQEVSRAYNTRLDEVLLAALGRAFQGWSGAPVLLVELEGHGRDEELLPGADLSRTVGWFTSFYPLLVDLRDAASPGAALKEVKERLRLVPRGGALLSALRYGSGVAALAPLPRAEVLFNNLGQLDLALPGSALFTPAEESAGPVRSPRQARRYLFEWVVAVAGGRLRLTGRYSTAVHRRESAERLADLLGSALRELIAHCTAPGAGGWTPSDVPQARLGQSELDRLAPWLGRHEVEDLYELTPLQEGLLFHAQLEPGSGYYNQQFACVLRGRLEVAGLRRAWEQTVARHPVLRTDFLWDRVAKRLQRVRRRVSLPWEAADWRGLPPAGQENSWARFRAADRRGDFAFDQAPLVRFALFQLADESHRFVFTFHHIVLDGWCMPLLQREVFSRYAALVRGEPYEPPAARPFRDYLAWLQRQDVARAEAFWRQELAGFSAATPLPGMPGNGVPEPGPRDPLVRRTVLSAAAMDRLLGFVRSQRLTLNTLAQGAWALLLARSSGERDVVFGATVAGRPVDLASSDGMLGEFLNTLPVRAEASPASHVADWLRELQTRQATARQFEYVPLLTIQRWSEVPRGLPLFESLVVFEIFPPGEALLQNEDGLEIESVEFFGSVHYPLHLMVIPGTSLELRLTFDPGRFEPAVVERLLGQLAVLLEGLCGPPQGLLGDVPWLTSAERSQLLVAWNDTAAGLSGATFPELFRSQASRSPLAVAVVFEGREWSYQELERRSASLAEELSRLGVGEDSVVAVLADRGLEFLATMLGLWRLGAAYLPLDPGHPAERHRRILEQVELAALLVSSPLWAMAGELLGVLAARTPVRKLEEVVEGGAGEVPAARVGSGAALAYVIFTSGSTGIPKGAMVSQQGMVNHLYAKLRDLSLSAADGVAQTASQCFDISVWQLVAPLLVGGRVHIYPDEVAHDPSRLLPALRRDGITVLETVPSLLRALLEEAQRDPLGAAGLAGLRWMIPTGEALPVDLARGWMAACPAVSLLNAYGPTECSDDVSHHRVVGSDVWHEGPVPIGRPVVNTRLYVLDEGLGPVPVAVAGELWVGGQGVGRGYLADPVKTAASFRPDPFGGEVGGRLYRTGDLARWRGDGSLIFLGRVDHQVKVRGFRIELGEIEAALAALPGVGESVVVVQGEGVGRRLVGFAVLDAGASSGEELRQALQERLPEPMVPAAIELLEELPLTANGKVDRRALAARQVTFAPAADRVLPRGPLEELLAGIWSDVLGCGEVGVHDNFFALGGDSILSLQVTSRVRQAGLSLTPRQLFEQPTIAGLAVAVGRLDEGTAAGALLAEMPQVRLEPEELERLAPQLVRADVESFYELTPLQEGLLFHAQLEPGSGFYCEQLGCVLQGRLKVDGLQRAWEATIAGHPVLRTDFLWHGLSRPLQRVRREVQVPWNLADWRGLSPVEQEERWTRFQADDRRQDFAFDQAPLLRFALFQLAEESHRFLFTYHHILLDGWCLPLLLREVFGRYTAWLRGQTYERPAPPPFYQYLAWLQRQGLDGAEAFWRRELAGFSAPTPLPGDGGQGPGHDPVVRRSVLSAAATARLLAFARSHELTLNTVVQGAWALLLARSSRERDVVFGTTVAGRPPYLAGSDSMIGLFINTLPVRADAAPQARSLAWLQELQARLAAARQFEHVPLATIQRWSEVPRGLPLFDSLLVFENYPTGESLRQEESGLEFEAVEFCESVHYPLHCVVLPGAALDVRLTFDPGRFEPAVVERLLGQLAVLLEGLCGPPQGLLGDVPWLTSAERSQLLVAWNDTAAGLSGATFPELFRSQASRSPLAVAVVFEGREWSYQELERRSASLAEELSRLGVGEDSVVAVLADRGLEFLATMLGLWRLGAAYLPLDPGHPAERHRRILEQVELAALLVSSPLWAMAGELLGVLAARTPVRKLEEVVEGGAGEVPAARVGSGAALAYVIFTSGSTGIPKGAMVSQQGMVNHLYAKLRDLSLSAADGVAQTASQCFDISVWQLVAPLLVGGRVHIYPDEVAHDPSRLLPALRRDGITVLETVPSLLRALLEEAQRDPLGAAGLAGLRWMIPTGEALPVDLARGWMAACPAVSLLNAYGPTECSDDVSHHRVVGSDVWHEGPVPIGRPVVNTRLYVLDEGLGPVPVAVAGELWVGGQGVGRGYLADPVKTAASFRPDPFGGEVGGRLYRTGDLARWRGDGSLIFLGRVDHQVKVRGFRIELGEIEAALAALPGVGESVVVVQGEGVGRRLVGFAVLDAGASSGEELRQALQERLPEPMVPAAIELLEELPLTANGKVDRRALAARQVTFAPAADRVLPRGPLEEMVAGVWCEVLAVERVGIYDDFFGAGGHSLLALQLVGRLQAVSGARIGLADLFDDPTVAGLARRIESALGAGETVREVPIEPAPTGTLPVLSFAQERLWFLGQLEADAAAFNIPIALRIAGRLDLPALRASLDEVVRRHEALRTNFREVEGRPQVEVQPAASWPVPEVDLRALGEPDRSRCLARLVQEDVRRPFDLTASLLARATVLRLRDEEQVLLLNLHHLVSDGWSMGILVREVMALYQARGLAAPPSLPPLPIQYRDYAVWQRQIFDEGRFAGHVAYWREHLAGAPPTLELPGRRPRPRPRGGSTRALWPAALSRAVQSFAIREASTPFMILLAGLTALLYRYTGQEDQVLGTLVANRQTTETEGLIGFFVNAMALRTQLSGAADFRQLLADVRTSTLEGFAHQDLPFEKLVAELNPDRDLARTPLFQIMLVVQNAPIDRLEVAGLDFSPLEVDLESPPVELYVTLFRQGDRFAGVVRYRSDLYEPVLVSRLLEHYQGLLEEAVAQPDLILDDLMLLRAEERHQILYEWNDRGTTCPRDLAVTELVAEWAERTPESAAARCRGEVWTYRELDRRSAALADYFAAAGAGADQVVAVLAERGLPFLATILAVWKAGAGYLPLDPHHPAERQRQVLAQARPCLLVVTAELAEVAAVAVALLPEGERPPLLMYDEAAAQPATLGLRLAVPPSDALSYVIFTSGSTGKPKGAMVVHRGMVNHLWAKVVDLDLGSEDAVAQTASQCFDISVWQFVAPLLVGGRIEIYPDDVAHDPRQLLTGVAQDRVTVLETVPSILRQMLSAETWGARGRPDLPDLRWMIPTGEALPPDLCEQWARSFPHVPLLNAYGPTECSDDVAHHFIAAGAGVADPIVPIGRPVANTQLYLLDRRLRAAPLGVVAELWVGGEGVGRGYLSDPVRTAQAFLPDPFGGALGSRLYRTGDLARLLADGRLEFLGRIDHQVKIRGFRIELGEIEAVLGEHPQVSSAVVLAVGSGPEARLVACVVPKEEVEAEDLLELVQRRLPLHMVPAAIVTLTALPLTRNGKIDRAALQLLASGAARVERPYVAPRDEVEEVVAEIFAAVLGVERVGVHDSFFELGGHSLIATRVVARVREAFGVGMSLRSFFEAPTVAELALAVQDLIVLQLEELSDLEALSLVEVSQSTERPG